MATEIRFNNGSGNGQLSYDTKPLTEPTLIYLMTSKDQWGQFRKRHPSHQSLRLVYLSRIWKNKQRAINWINGDPVYYGIHVPHASVCFKLNSCVLLLLLSLYECPQTSPSNHPGRLRFRFNFLWPWHYIVYMDVYGCFLHLTTSMQWV